MSPNTTAFEGKRGQSVEGFPEVFAEAMRKAEAKEIINGKELDALTDKYLKDQSFRRTIGPGMEVYADWGYPEALFDLQIDLDF